MTREEREKRREEFAEWSRNYRADMLRRLIAGEFTPAREAAVADDNRAVLFAQREE